MKSFEFNLNNGNINIFFPKFRIKHKIDILKILINATRLMLNYIEVDINNNQKIILNIDKMSRLFFFDDEKFYSINFPFTVQINKDQLEFTYNEITIDSYILSSIFTILNDIRFDSKDFLTYTDSILEYGSDDNIWVILKTLILQEDGYVRYDLDRENYLKAKEKQQEHMHPENHLDFFYFSSNTLKIGLNNKITRLQFIDYFNTKTDCHYLNIYKK